MTHSSTLPLKTLSPVGIIGGNGSFGKWLSRYFSIRGCEVLVSDKNTEYSAESLCKKVTTVILATPIEVAPQILERILPELTPSHLFVEILSVKSPLLPLMSSLPGEILSLHPMFSPKIASLEGQTVTYSVLRGGEKEKTLRESLLHDKAKLVEIDLLRHDHLMGAVQALFHACSLTFAHTLHSLNYSFEEIAPLMSPPYRVFFSMVGRILHQDPALYRNIAFTNPVSAQLLKKYGEELSLLQSSIEGKENEQYEKFFDTAKEFCGEHLEELWEESATIVAALTSPRKISV